MRCNRLIKLHSHSVRITMSDDRPIDLTTRADSPSMHATALSDIEMDIPATPDAVSVAATDDTDLESMFSVALTDLESGNFDIDLGLGRSKTPSVSEASTAASVDARSFPTSNVAPVNRPQYAPLDVFCGTCGRTVEMERARCRSKQKQTWICKRCEVKVVMLRRKFGSWPIPGFAIVSKEEQQAFYRDCSDETTARTLHKLSQRFNINEVSESTCYKNSGKFLPLNVWEEKGYNVADIEEKSLPEDIRMDPAIGLTYRVKVMELAQKGEKRHVFSQCFSAKQSANAKQRSANANAKKSKSDASTGAVTETAPHSLWPAANSSQWPPAGGEEALSSSEEASSSSDSSSSDSSSSSSSKKKSKKKIKTSAKNDKKEKRGRAKKTSAKKAIEIADSKALAEHNKATAKARAQKKKLAEALLTSIWPQLEALESTLDQPLSSVLQESVRRTGIDMLLELKVLQKRCRAVVIDPSLDDELMTQQDLRTCLKHANGFNAMMKGVMNAGN